MPAELGEALEDLHGHPPHSRVEGGEEPDRATPYDRHVDYVASAGHVPPPPPSTSSCPSPAQPSRPLEVRAFHLIAMRAKRELPANLGVLREAPFPGFADYYKVFARE
ncbi:MAG: hypothetical protein BLITH_0292 [Brockia lithotrophica]|uniref:Uncharacterized protein n=1 Tax=Brockia lithotrophica TaxID=933949 RepID=A0A2T5GAJ8_9BACL|nr:MAG: hypothetical protein BLITH_0292 [Brockia lithotrophica]